jgi:hypothetical protein
MQVREHDRICARQLRGPYYYSRWFYCARHDCRTSTVLWDKFKVWNNAEDSAQDQRLTDAFRQLRPSD